MIKKAATISTPTQEVTDLGGGKWRLTTATTLKTMTTEFEFDKPFDEKASIRYTPSMVYKGHLYKGQSITV